MAWDTTEYCGQEITTGDKPFDELSVCLTKIAAAYTDRFSRKPTVAEVVYAFKVVVSANAGDYFADATSIAQLHISLEKSH